MAGISWETSKKAWPPCYSSLPCCGRWNLLRKLGSLGLNMSLSASWPHPTLECLREETGHLRDGFTQVTFIMKLLSTSLLSLWNSFDLGILRFPFCISVTCAAQAWNMRLDANMLGFFGSIWGLPKEYVQSINSKEKKYLHYWPRHPAIWWQG